MWLFECWTHMRCTCAHLGLVKEYKQNLSHIMSIYLVYKQNLSHIMSIYLVFLIFVLGSTRIGFHA